jgi:hypothetical protein
MSIINYKSNENNLSEIIKYFFENSNFPNYKFTYDRIDIEIKNNNSEISLLIDYYENGNIEILMNNLPQNISELIINISKDTNTKNLENIFRNLPYCLKKIKFIYKESKLSEIKNLEQSGKFNLLFGIKIPFGCDLQINYENNDYNLFYNNLDNTIELQNENIQQRENLKKIQIIKYVPIIIKYVSNPYVPLKFWFNTASNALPQVALIYHQIDIKFDIEQINFD